MVVAVESNGRLLVDGADARYWVMLAVSVDVVYNARMSVVRVQKGPLIS